jgi:valyl-tRNA synthetase
MPFVTEEIYQRLPHPENESIMVSSFPVFDDAQVDEESEGHMDMIMGVVDVIRNIRGETGIAPNVKIEVIIRANGYQPLLQEYEFYIRELARIERLAFTGDNTPKKAAIGVYKGIEVFVPIKDLIDTSAELGRIKKELVKIEEEIERLFNKLNNRLFIEKAPPEVVKKNESNYSELQEKKGKLIASKKVLEKLSGN